MAVKIVTDSTADLPPALAKELGITVVPLNVNFGTEVYRDGVEIFPDEFYKRLVTSPSLPTTSHPTVGDFLQSYQELSQTTNQAAQRGASIDEVVNEAQLAIPRVRFFGLLDTLKYLQKGGWIGKAQAFVGSLLRIKPLLVGWDGEAHPLERALAQRLRPFLPNGEVFLSQIGPVVGTYLVPGVLGVALRGEAAGTP